jgi:hypothetical protein
MSRPKRADNHFRSSPESRHSLAPQYLSVWARSSREISTRRFLGAVVGANDWVSAAIASDKERRISLSVL